MVSAMAIRSAPKSHDDLDTDAGVMGDCGDNGDLFGGLGTAAPDVGAAVSVGGGYHVLHRSESGCDGPPCTVSAGYQGGELDIGIVAQGGSQLGCIGQCGHFRR